MTTTLEKRPKHSLSPYWTMPFDRFFRNDFLDLWDGNDIETVPSVNFSEEKNNFMIDVAAPGLKKEDFNINVEGNLLTISSEKETTNKEKEKEGFIRKEYNYSFFSRTVTLPDSANSKGIEAKYNDGVLTLIIPKKEEAQKTTGQKIKVQ